MIEIPSWVIMAFISLLGLIFTILGFSFGRIKEARDRADAKLKEHSEKAKEEGVIVTKLEYISESVKNINSDMCSQFGNVDGRLRKQEEDANKRIERLVGVEHIAKSAQHRLDEHESRIQSLEKDRLVQ